MELADNTSAFAGSESSSAQTLVLRKRITSSKSITAAEGSPVVFIFGWMGGALKHVSKYSQYYQDRGYDVIIALTTYQGMGVSHL
jgi:hypothetical protein